MKSTNLEEHSPESSLLKTKVAPGRKILFLSLMDYSWSPRLVAEFARLGCECAVMSPPGSNCSATRFVKTRFHLPPHHGLWLGLLAARFRLEHVCRSWHPDLIVPLDDEAAWLLRGLATDRLASAGLRRLLEISVGSPSGYEAACSRTHFLDLATRLGVRAPASRAVDGTTALNAAEAMGFPVMIKINRTWQGTGVAIAHNRAELAGGIAASGLYGGRLLRRSRKTARQIVSWLSGSWMTSNRIFELQQYIPGVPAMRSVIAWQGRVLGGVSFLKASVNPKPFGPSTVLSYIDQPEMAETAARLVSALGLSGFASFDFVIADKGGHAHVIELNPRAVPAIHVGRFFGHDLCGALGRELGWRTAAPEAAQLAEDVDVVLFPNEIARDPESAWLHSTENTFHDVPWDDPGVVEHSYRELVQLHPDHAGKIADLLRIKDPVRCEGG